MADFFERFICEANNKYSVIIEDDGRVCYAYLMQDKEIIGDVWLYNSISTPTAVDWSAKGELPFLNPLSYVNQNESTIFVDRLQNVSVEWTMLNGELGEATIFVKERLMAKLKRGSKPGWSVNASKDGPLAKSLK